MSYSWFRILAATLLLAICCYAGPDDEREEAPRFSAKSLDGDKFSNESVKGKVVLLQFWTTWCPYCRGEESLVNDITTEFQGKGLVVLAIDVGESKKKVKEYLAEHPRTPHIVLTSDTNLAAMYAANSYPIYVVIDRDGFVAGTQHGAGGERRLRNLLRLGGIESSEDEKKQEPSERKSTSSAR